MACNPLAITPRAWRCDGDGGGGGLGSAGRAGAVPVVAVGLTALRLGRAGLQGRRAAAVVVIVIFIVVVVVVMVSCRAGNGGSRSQSCPGAIALPLSMLSASPMKEVVKQTCPAEHLTNGHYAPGTRKTRWATAPGCRRPPDMQTRAREGPSS